MSNAILQGGASGTGQVTVLAPNTNSNRTLTLPDVDGQLAVAGVIPAFRAYYNGTQNPSANTWTKATLDTESFDTNSNFSTATYRFTPTVAGYYQFSGGGIATGSPPEAYVAIRQNGSGVLNDFFNASGTNQWSGVLSDLIYANGTTDYFELWVFSAAGSPAFSGLRLAATLVRTP